MGLLSDSVVREQRRTSSWFFFMVSSSSLRESICMLRSVLATPSSPSSIFSPAMSASTD